MNKKSARQVWFDKKILFISLLLLLFSYTHSKELINNEVNKLFIINNEIGEARYDKIKETLLVSPNLQDELIKLIKEKRGLLEKKQKLGADGNLVEHKELKFKIKQVEDLISNIVKKTYVGWANSNSGSGILRHHSFSIGNCTLIRISGGDVDVINPTISYNWTPWAWDFYEEGPGKSYQVGLTFQIAALFSFDVDRVTDFGIFIAPLTAVSIGKYFTMALGLGLKTSRNTFQSSAFVDNVIVGFNFTSNLFGK